jgi:hypothetical protein
MRLDAHVVKGCRNLRHSRAGLAAKSPYMNHCQPKGCRRQISLEHAVHNAFAPISHRAIQKNGWPEDPVHFAILSNDLSSLALERMASLKKRASLLFKEV